MVNGKANIQKLISQIFKHVKDRPANGINAGIMYLDVHGNSTGYIPYTGSRL